LDALATIEKLESNFELALRQAEQDLDKKIKLERMQFEKRLSELKEAHLAQIGQMRQQLDSSFSFAKSDGPVSMGQLEGMLNRMKAEIVDELRGNVPAGRAKEPAKKKSVEIVLDEKDLDGKGFELAAEPKASKQADDAVVASDGKTGNIQEELFEMIRELAQEKRNQELKVPAETKATLGSRLFKKNQ
jgi:hypothetical protein